MACPLHRLRHDETNQIQETGGQTTTPYRCWTADTMANGDGPSDLLLPVGPSRGADTLSCECTAVD